MIEQMCGIVNGEMVRGEGFSIMVGYGKRDFQVHDYR